MSTLGDRLRGVIRPSPSERNAPPHESGPEGPPLRDHNYAADLLGGEWCERGGQRFLLVDRTYTPGYRHGRMTVADSLPPLDEPWPRLSLLAGGPCRGRMLFFDLETTGLAGGAGTYAFLVGCGWFAGGVFRTRQFFLSSFAAERVLLEAVAETAQASGTIVTYNGKSFDLPLMETRFVMQRLDTPFAGLPHVDMLHPARRLWRRDDPSSSGFTEDPGCRLSALEHAQCGYVRDGDVPGFEIPSRYFHYVRSGDARALEAVLEHNRLDLLSLALLTARAAQLLDEGPGAATTAREALGLGRLYERAGLTAEARDACARAAEISGADSLTRAEALRLYAVLSRRERRHEEAAAAWRRILELRQCPAPIRREAIEALAVHHEHRLRDPLSARRLALQSMDLPHTPARRQALQHRLARLNRKVGEPPAAAPLF